jgi:hypothetical protein
MDRLAWICAQYLDGAITATEFRNAMILKLAGIKEDDLAKVALAISEGALK